MLWPQNINLVAGAQSQVFSINIFFHLSGPAGTRLIRTPSGHAKVSVLFGVHIKSENNKAGLHCMHVIARIISSLLSVYSLHTRLSMY